MKHALMIFGGTIGFCAFIGIFSALVLFPLAEKFPKAADVAKKAAIAVAIFAAISYVVNNIDEKSKDQQREHDQELWNEAYRMGQDSVIENPEAYIDFSDSYEEGYDDGFLDGWHACNDGIPLENPVISEFERTK